MRHTLQLDRGNGVHQILRTSIIGVICEAELLQEIMKNCSRHKFICEYERTTTHLLRELTFINQMSIFYNVISSH